MSQLTQTNQSSVARASRDVSADRVNTIQPRVNIHQDTDGYTLEVDMPGVAKTGVDVTFEDGKLTLSGRREKRVENASAIYRESSDASYRRVFDLDPSIDTSRIEASIDQGLLTVRLPKAEASKPRKIEVR